MKGKLLALGLVLMLSGLIFSGCGPAKEVKVDASANGRQVELQKGQTLVITLESHPTTGFMWEVVEFDEHILPQMGEAEFRPTFEAEDAPGWETFRFQAMQAGQIALKLVYRQPWEEDVDAKRTFSLNVVVR